MIKYKKGNLLDAEETLICHGCNCFNTMGAGIAKFLKIKWPNVYEVDCKTKKGDKGKLGTVTLAEVAKNKFVANCYTQFRYHDRHRKDLFEYKAFEEICKYLNQLSSLKNLTIAMPLIGAGLCGGKWDRIAKIIEDNIDKEVTIYVLPKEWKDEYESN